MKKILLLLAFPWWVMIVVLWTMQHELDGYHCGAIRPMNRERR